MDSASDFTELSEEIIQSFGGDLDVMSSEIFSGDTLSMEDDDNEPDDIIILHMDIREPLTKLQQLLEEKLSVSLYQYEFYLQDTQQLEADKTLVDQCVKGEGLVQINVQIQTTTERINIVDVLKPTDTVLATVEDNGEWQIDNENGEEPEESDVDIREDVYEGASSPIDSNERPVLNWVLDPKFKKEQARLKFPENPNDWTVPQVKHWFQWAVREFDLTDISMSDWTISGQELCAMKHEDFCKKLPHDPGNVFWTHIQLLQEMKFVSVVHRTMEEKCNNGDGSSSSPNNEDSINEYERCESKEPQLENSYSPMKEYKIMRKPVMASSARNLLTVSTDVSSSLNATGEDSPVGSSTTNTGSGNNGQVQLWQFLLEILTDPEHVDIIRWVGVDGEFKLTDPESVARLWGIKKNKPAMNYEKLSRALRYYYDGDMISKVSGKRFAYKFDCDLKLLIGFDASELAKLVSRKPTFVNDAVKLEQLSKKSEDEE